MSATGAVHAVKSQALSSPSRAAGQDRLQVAVSRFAAAIERGDVLGAVLKVTQGDRVLVDEAFGYRDGAKTKPMTKDTLFQMASNTKALTTAAVMTLVDDGKLELDSKISEWFPTFDGPYGSQVTVRHFLTHTSGLRRPTLFLYPLTPRSGADPNAPTLIQECCASGRSVWRRNRARASPTATLATTCWPAWSKSSAAKNSVRMSANASTGRSRWRTRATTSRQRTRRECLR